MYKTESDERRCNLISKCTQKWQGEMVQREPQEWKCKILVNTDEQWRAEFIEKAKEEWRVNLMAKGRKVDFNKTDDEWRYRHVAHNQLTQVVNKQLSIFSEM